MLSLIGLTYKINNEKLSPSFVVVDLMLRIACAVLKERREGNIFCFYLCFVFMTLGGQKRN